MSHPLQSFAFCPQCGSPRFTEKDFKSKECSDCGFVHYLNASAAVAVFLTNPQRQLLVARRAHDPAKGMLDLPGGFVDPGETIEAALQREVAEETGITLATPKYLFSLPNTYHYSGVDIPTVDLFFHAETGDVPFQAGDDVAELFFLSADEIHPESFGLTSIRKAVQLFVELKLKKPSKIFPARKGPDAVLEDRYFA
jgi:NADH pyrophosphatase NudC (nudix superfamily)